MQLVIDIGNTRVKVGLFEKNELIQHFIFESTNELIARKLFEKYSIENCLIASVINEIESFISEIKIKTNVIVFTNETPIPIKNLYQSAHTLGSDRLAAAIGGNASTPNENILVIDAGTCIKYNFVNSNNEYIGGGISPGLQMRFKALHTFTARLPLLKVDENFNSLIGKTSEESILSGVELGAFNEVKGFIEEYNSQFNNLKVFLTGGDTEFFAKRLKNRIFADQNLILKGLNSILSHTINYEEYSKRV